MMLKLYRIDQNGKMLLITFDLILKNYCCNNVVFSFLKLTYLPHIKLIQNLPVYTFKLHLYCKVFL